MSELTYAQLLDLEDQFREMLRVNYPSISKFTLPNRWMLDAIESLLKAYPELLAVNFFDYSYNQLLALVNEYIIDIEFSYDEEVSMLILKPSPLKPLLTKA